MEFQLSDNASMSAEKMVLPKQKYQLACLRWMQEKTVPFNGSTITKKSFIITVLLPELYRVFFLSVV